MKRISKSVLYSLAVFLIILCFSFKIPVTGKKGNLKVIATCIRNNNGKIGFCLFKKSDGFPNHPDKALLTAYVKVNGSISSFTFMGIDTGMYAVSVFHDENSDKQVNSNFIGIPTEGIGVSNNVKGHFGPPKFDDAKFDFNQAGETITIAINYL
jgi:uncharacterized protein (DUF2141 family)